MPVPSQDSADRTSDPAPPSGPGSTSPPITRLRRILRTAQFGIAGIVVVAGAAVTLDARIALLDQEAERIVHRELDLARELAAELRAAELMGADTWRETAERLRRTVDASAAHIAGLPFERGHDHPGEVRLANEAAARAHALVDDIERLLATPRFDAVALARLEAGCETWRQTLGALDEALAEEHDAHRNFFVLVLQTLGVLVLLGLLLQWVVVVRPALRAAEAHLQEAQRREREHRRLALVAQRTTNGVIVAGRDGRIEWVNGGYERISGRTLADVRGKSIVDLIRKGRTDPTTIAALDDALVAARPFECELSNRASSGRDYVVQLQLQPLVEGDGTVTGFMLMGSDVTEERALARELEERERHFRLLVESTHVVVWEFDPEADRFTYISPKIERYGRTVDEWSRPGFWSTCVHPEDLATAQRCRSDASRLERDHRFQYRMVVPAGTVWIDEFVSFTREPDGRAMLRGVFIDVTHQTEAERELEELTDVMRVETERLELALAGGEIGLWDWAPRADSLHVNARWASMLGVTLEELSGTTADLSSRCHPEDRESIREAMERHFRGESETYEALYRMRHASGEWVWTLARGKVVNRDDIGTVTRVVGTQLDRTAEVERRAELEALRRSAEEANRTKSEFLANMSHEIRTPLTAILGYADMLREDADSRVAADSRVGMIDTIRSAGNHLLTVINDILDLSKIEADKMTIEAIDTDLAGMLGEVVRMVTPRAGEKGVGLALELAVPTPTRIVSDPTRLRQIVMNLLGNAVKFTEEGRVTLRVARADAGRLVLEIEDTGAGMDEEQTSRLFRPFIQADGSVTRKFGGTGLGLTISRRLARLMGGEVSLVRSAPGKGSCFALEIPLTLVADTRLVTALDVADVSKASAPGERSDAPTLTGHILLAEDGPMNQRLIRAILVKAGAKVSVANHGLHALELLAAARAEGADVDLLLTDMQMPEMDGYTLARALRDRGERLPIVALTAHAMAEDRQRCIDAGCDAYATKPIDKLALLTTCDVLLRTRAAPRIDAA